MAEPMTDERLEEIRYSIIRTRSHVRPRMIELWKGELLLAEVDRLREECRELKDELVRALAMLAAKKGI